MTAEIAVREGPPPVLSLLGPVEVLRGDSRFSLGGPQVKRMIVALVEAGGKPVSHDRLKEWVWQGQPTDGYPADALHGLASAVRKAFKDTGISASLGKEGLSYRLRIADEHVDVRLFREEVRQAVHLLASGQDTPAVRLLNQALARSKGEPLTGLDGRLVGQYREALGTEVTQARLVLAAARIKGGEHGEQIAPLKAVVEQDRDNVAAAWLLMHAYFRDHRWELAHRVLQGVPTAPEFLRDLERRMLKSDPDLYRPEAIDLPGAPAPPVIVTRVDTPEPDEPQQKQEEPQQEKPQKPKGPGQRDKRHQHQPRRG
ncbi:AfsR/SARP family transcriptional regulator [Nonomuraea endophytica]|uniref:DNA-binding SARP family transcriptional activator n=1 Tax=Nonomuraea endophytica TaxID=714136 RepID=A0A7W8AH25_9ACTN|nr:BTAD domain-containing putative transcriptional regulator [Nonomuraea endophytica]MBB5084981.1 DNA-binding SARP family transcriptional activator [Nonomuraea endophytica]